MDYSLKWAKAEKLFEQLRKQGKQLGKRASSRPQLLPHLSIYWRAFNRLHGRRRFDGMAGPQPIPYSEMESFIRLQFQMEWDQVNRLIRYIEAMDDVYLADYAAKQEAKSKR